MNIPNPPILSEEEKENIQNLINPMLDDFGFKCLCDYLKSDNDDEWIKDYIISSVKIELCHRKDYEKCYINDNIPDNRLLIVWFYNLLKDATTYRSTFGIKICCLDCAEHTLKFI